jgi:Methyltransferase domain
MTMVRIPPRLKHWLIPLWNGGYQLAWRVGEASRRAPASPIRALRHLRTVRANALSAPGDPSQAGGTLGPDATPGRGDGPARVVRLHLVRRQALGAPARLGALADLSHRHSAAPGASVAKWVRHPEAQALRVAEINRIDGLHDVLQILPYLASSDFTPGATPGAVIDGVRHEDLTRLTYPDAAFDLVLTSETLEHVPDLAAALREGPDPKKRRQ